MVNQILEGTIKVKLSPKGIRTLQDIGMSDAAITHAILDRILAYYLNPAVREDFSFHDCGIKESKEEELPF